MRKLFFIFICISGLVVAPHTFAETTQSGFVALAPIPGLTDPSSTSVLNADSLANFFNQLYKYLIGLAAALAVIEIIWGGLEISTQDSVSKHAKGKERIYEALTGLLLILAPVVVFSIINPSILNLSLNLPELDTKTTPASTSTGSPVSQTPAIVDTSTGCSVSGTLLKKAECPSPQAAQNFVASCPNSGKVASCQTETSTGCADKSITATCNSDSTEPYVFLDVSNAYIPLDLFSDYQPLSSSNANANNGADAVKFASNCSQDGGMTCLSGSFLSVGCTYTTAQPTSQSNKCYTAKLTCELSSFVNKLSLCSSNPSWNPIK